MSTGPTSFLPPTQTAKSAKAAVQAVAVRLISVPSTLQNNISPVRVEGTVAGQEPDGSLVVETERGIVQLILKDKQGLPKGMRLEIDIPAGRAPQNAAIRAAPPPPEAAPTLSQQIRLDTPLTSLERNVNLDSETLDVVIQSRSTALQPPVSNAASRIAGGELQLGQFVRLIPIPPNAAANALANPVTTLPQTGNTTFGAPFSTSSFPALTASASIEPVLSALVSNIQSLPASDTALRPQLVTLLSRISVPPTLQSSPNSATQQLIQNINRILQSPEAQQIIQSAQNPAVASGASATPRSFNPTVPIDVQILGFQNSAASTTPASQLQANATAPLSLPLTGTPRTAGATQSAPAATLIISSQSVSPTSQSSTAITIAQVVGQSAEGLPVVEVPAPASGMIQNYVMQFAAQNIQVPASPDAASAPLLMSILPQNPSTSASHGIASWGALQELFFALNELPMQGGVAASAAQSLAGILPSPAQPHNLGAMALFFLAMVKSGDIDSWMPQNALDILRQTTRGNGILKSAADDMVATSKTQGMAMPHDWRGVTIPLLWEQQIHKIPLYYKHLPDEGAENEERKKRRLRFLFDLNLSRMGGVQVDGFMEAQKLDLIVRTKSPLSPPMQSRMKQLYAGAVERSNLTGELSFQFKPEHWVDFSQPLEMASVEA